MIARLDCYCQNRFEVRVSNFRLSHEVPEECDDAESGAQELRTQVYQIQQAHEGSTQCFPNFYRIRDPKYTPVSAPTTDPGSSQSIQHELHYRLAIPPHLSISKRLSSKPGGVLHAQAATKMRWDLKRLSCIHPPAASTLSDFMLPASTYFLHL